MCIKVYYILLLFFNFNRVIIGQTGSISCTYSNSGNYTCALAINNPNGFNNFSYINGTHLTGLNDDNVLHVRTTSTISTNVPSIICEKFKSLQSISLNRLQINKIDEYSFKECQNILYISLSFNKISVVDEKAFNNNLILRELWLYNNLIANLSVNVFLNLHNLKHLRININNITDLPANIFKPLKTLDSIAINKNKISKLRMEWFEDMKILRALWIGENFIEKFQKNIFAPLKNLLWFYSETNKLSVIQADSFGTHPNLKIISFANNQITAIDEQFIDNTGVTDFAMVGNICSDANITDTSTTRDFMRTELRQCFENYNNLPTGNI